MADKGSKRSFILGCLGGGLLILIIGGAFLGFSGYRSYKSMVSESPRIATYRPSEKDKQAYAPKAKILNRAVVHGEGGDLTLTENDLNTLIVRESARLKQKNNVHLELEGDNVVAKASIPYQDKFINFIARSKLSAKDGKLNVQILSVANMEGKKLPEAFVKVIRSELDKRLLKHKDAQEKFKNVRLLEVRDSQVYVEFNKATK